MSVVCVCVCACASACACTCAHACARARVRACLCLDLLDERLLVVRVKGRVAAEHDVQYDPHRPNVGGAAVLDTTARVPRQDLTESTKRQEEYEKAHVVRADRDGWRTSLS
eukprot:5293333-Pleurochrysis_carterae.AAC.2